MKDDELPVFDWAVKEVKEKPKEEEPKTCNLDDEECLSCGS